MAQGTFWGGGNVPHLTKGVGYTGVYFSPNALTYMYN